VVADPYDLQRWAGRGEGLEKARSRGSGPGATAVPDLGPAGAVYTEGWDRHVVATGAEAKAKAKATKNTINTARIYPPLTDDRQALVAAAAPELQGRPARGGR
jgi:NADH dehydrogenase